MQPIDALAINDADAWDLPLVEHRVTPDLFIRDARTADSAFLHTSQEAMVKLSACDFSIFGGFPATLKQISADTLMPERPGERQEAFTRSRVRTKQSKPNGRVEPLAILPGTVATVDIKTGQKTVLYLLYYLLKPIIKTKEMALRER